MQASQITELLQQIHAGDAKAREDLFAVAYPDLRRLARARLRNGGSSTVLDATSLVHESYLRFVQTDRLRAEDRRAFFAYASQVMRSVILNAARERQTERRGGHLRKVMLSTDLLEETGAEQAIIDLHEALLALEQVNPRLAELAQMRYFAGYSSAEIAQALEVSERTVERDLEKARLILAQALN